MQEVKEEKSNLVTSEKLKELSRLKTGGNLGKWYKNFGIGTISFYNSLIMILKG